MGEPLAEPKALGEIEDADPNCPKSLLTTKRPRQVRTHLATRLVVRGGVLHAIAPAQRLRG
ncbi:MAG: hypothetical protein WAV54_09135 [Acidimicrobiales bacterium]